jgi:integrase
MLGQGSTADNIMAGQRHSKRLTARTVETLAASGRHADGDGLYLTVRSGGSKQWIFLYRSVGRLREMGLGSPASGVTLARARQLAAEARGKIVEGKDPLEVRRKAEQQTAAMPKFGHYALSLVDRIEIGFSNPKHRQQWRNTLTTYCKAIWTLPIDEVDTKGILECLTPVWTSKPETASRLRGRIERVLNAAKAERLRTGENPAAWRGHLDATLPRPSKLSRGHHAALAYLDLPAFMRDLRKRAGTAARALEFLILTATRTSEALNATWREFDLESAIWTIPAARMKARAEHRVPLSPGILGILNNQKSEQEDPFGYVFGGQRAGRPLSNMSLSMMLRRMNRNDITAHGFRSTFSDWASEVSSFSSELRETALAHTIKGKAERAYRRGDALEKRKKMMEAWTDFCVPNGREKDKFKSVTSR